MGREMVRERRRQAEGESGEKGGREGGMREGKGEDGGKREGTSARGQIDDGGKLPDIKG